MTWDYIIQEVAKLLNHELELTCWFVIFFGSQDFLILDLNAVGWACVILFIIVSTTFKKLLVLESYIIVAGTIKHSFISFTCTYTYRDIYVHSKPFENTLQKYSPLLSKIQHYFFKNKDNLLHNHCTLIKFREFNTNIISFTLQSIFNFFVLCINFFLDSGSNSRSLFHLVFTTL